MGELDSILENPTHLEHLQRISPMIHEAYMGLKPSEEKHFQNLLGHIMELYQNCFKKGPMWWEHTEEEVFAEEDEFIASGREKIRRLPNYENKRGKDEKLCNKNSYNSNNMTGTFFLTCEHGYFIVSLLMQTRETPWHPFHVLMTYFRQLPKTVVIKYWDVFRNRMKFNNDLILGYALLLCQNTSISVTAVNKYYHGIYDST